MIYFGRFLAENILSINVKIYFPRWRVGHYGLLPVTFHSDALSEIDFMYSTKESENKPVECIFCNGKFSEDEREENCFKCLWGHLDFTAAENAEYTCNFDKCIRSKKWFLHNL